MIRFFFFLLNCLNLYLFSTWFWCTNKSTNSVESQDAGAVVQTIHAGPLENIFAALAPKYVDSGTGNH